MVEFVAGFLVDNENGVFDAADGSATAMTNVVVEGISKIIRTWDWCGVSVFLVHSCCLASGFDWVSAKVADFDGIVNDLLYFVQNIGDVTKASAFLKVLGCD